MGEEKKCGGGFNNAGALSGATWFAGWLFTIGYLGLSFWQSVLALIVWPYFLGAALR